jgi:peroxiredoxin
VDNGDDIAVTASMDNLPESIKFNNSPQNEQFNAYQRLLKELNQKELKYREELAKATTKKDSTAIYDKATENNKQMVAFRRNYVKNNPGTLLSSIFYALESPQAPEGKHYLPDGKEDSFFAYKYYRAHYWDGFNFKDDRLIHTPLLERKLDEYFNKVIIQNEDSVIIAADTILQRVKGSENLFKFTLNWLSTNAQTSKIMGMDKVFVHLVDNYYMKGDAVWLSQEELTKYIERAQKIAPNIINNPAPQLKLLDAENKPTTLYDFKAKYTLLVFYDPDCGHCQKEIPVLDSVYRAELKAKGVRIFAFNVEVDEAKWRSFITKNKLEDWFHVWDPKRVSRYWASYDIIATPALYLLDEEKIIRGKKLDHTNISRVIEITEHKQKMGKN